MAEYNTEQRKQLIDFLEKHKDLSLSIDGWIDMMQKESSGRVPGRTTVYRTMERLEREGLVIRTREGRHSQFQLAQCFGEHGHLHLKCVGCGKLFHMSHEASHVLEKSIFSDSRFNIDQSQTVIYGKCAECK